MESAESAASRPGAINYDEPPIAQIEVEGTEYRVDAGRGSAVAVSHREPGTWTWQPLAEGRFEGTGLKVKSLPYSVVSVLGAALALAMKESAEA